MNKEDYRLLFQRLMPFGPAWTRHKDSVMSMLANGIAAIYLFVNDRVEKTTREMFPYSCEETLEDWEKAYELPEPCPHAGYHAEGLTAEERADAVVAKINRSMSLTAKNIEDLAARLGYSVRAIEFPQTVCGIARCGDRLGGDHNSSFHILVNIDGNRFSYARTGMGRCSDYMCRVSWADDLECLLNRIKHAHTVVTVRNNTGA